MRRKKMQNRKKKKEAEMRMKEEIRERGKGGKRYEIIVRNSEIIAKSYADTQNRDEK